VVRSLRQCGVTVSELFGGSETQKFQCLPCLPKNTDPKLIHGRGRRQTVAGSGLTLGCLGETGGIIIIIILLGRYWCEGWCDWLMSLVKDWLGVAAVQ
jgi:hypothetical protein